MEYRHLLLPREDVKLTGDEVVELAKKSVADYHEQAGKTLSLITDRKLLEVAYETYCYKSDDYEVKYVVEMFSDGHTVHIEVYQ